VSAVLDCKRVDGARGRISCLLANTDTSIFFSDTTASSPSPNSRLSTRFRGGAFQHSLLRYQSVKCSDFSPPYLSPPHGCTCKLAGNRVCATRSPMLLFYRLTRELEKKFSDRTVVFVAQRRMMRKPGRTSRSKQPRPRSRTLKAVHDAILDDLVYPTEITGKRIRQSTDGNRTIKV
jgi:hypothetical protein